LIIELLLLLFLLGGAYSALVPLLIVAAICIVVYAFAMRSEPVRYDDEKQRKERTQSQRISGGVIGFAVGIAVILGYFYWMISD
jgi:Na+/H+ antiporter NhaD/arsenite permease-like protein